MLEQGARLGVCALFEAVLPFDIGQHPVHRCRADRQQLLSDRLLDLNLLEAFQMGNNHRQIGGQPLAAGAIQDLPYLVEDLADFLPVDLRPAAPGGLLATAVLDQDRPRYPDLAWRPGQLTQSPCKIPAVVLRQARQHVQDLRLPGPTRSHVLLSNLLSDALSFAHGQRHGCLLGMGP